MLSAVESVEDVRCGKLMLDTGDNGVDASDIRLAEALEVFCFKLWGNICLCILVGNG